jgi:hypothetical protein
LDFELGQLLFSNSADHYANTGAFADARDTSTAHSMSLLVLGLWLRGARDLVQSDMSGLLH